MNDSELITVKVTSIYSKNGLVVCDGKGYRVNSHYTNIIIPSRFSYEAYSVEQGDKITIQKTDQGEYVLQSVLSVRGDTLPDLSTDKSEYILKFNSDTKVHITPNSSGKYNIEVKAGGNITVSAGEDVVVDEGGTPKKVAYQNHTHDYSGSTSDGASYSGTTTTPNEDGTEVEIE
jgi:hypothetical protein